MGYCDFPGSVALGYKPRFHALDPIVLTRVRHLLMNMPFSEH